MRVGNDDMNNRSSDNGQDPKPKFSTRAEYLREYYKRNKDKYRKWQHEYWKRKLEHDPDQTT